MRNFVQNGDIITLPAPRNLASGEGCLVGAMFGVSASTVASGEPADLAVTGVFVLPKMTDGALDVGQPAFWDNTARKVTATATDNTRIGVAAAAATSGAVFATVRLDG